MPAGTAPVTDELRVERDGPVAIVTIARPAKKNAFTGAMYAAFADALAQFEDDAGQRCLVVRAEGGAFSAGNDLNDFLALDGLDESVPVVRVLRALARGTKPLIAGVDGAAVGIGTTLLLHCDLVYATPAARFAVPFVPLGLVPEAGSSRLLVELVGHRRAMAMFLLGETLDAPTAEALGLVNALVEADALDERVMAAARRVAGLPPGAVRATRALCRAAPVGIDDTVSRENAQFAARLAAPDTRAAIEAVLAARSSKGRRDGEGG